MTDYVMLPSLDDQTQILQDKLDKCRINGGRIVFKSGIYNFGSVRIYSNTELYFEKDCQIEASQSLDKYTDFNLKTKINYLDDPYFVKKWNLPKYYFHSLFCANNAKNIVIIAEENVILNGHDLNDPNGEEGFRGPMMFVFSNIQNLTLQGYEVKNSANWSHAIVACTNVDIKNINIKAGHDGFNLHHSNNIIIKNCKLETGDDCVAGYDIHNLVVKNCNFNSACNCFRIGGENILVENCSFKGPGKYPHLSSDTKISHDFFRYYAIDSPTEKNICVGKNIKFENIDIENCRSLISYGLNKDKEMQAGSPLTDVTFSKISAKNLQQTSVIDSKSEKCVITFKDCNISFNKKLYFLLINKNVDIDLENVKFEYQIKIKKDNRVLAYRGLVSCKG